MKILNKITTKQLIVCLAFIITAQYARAQNEYKIEMANSPDSKIEIHVGSKNVFIIGHDKDEIIISTDFSGEFVDVPKEEIADIPERASGLKPLANNASDNTGIGLVVEKQNNNFNVLKISQNARNKTYTFLVPNRANLQINDLHAQISTTYHIENYKGEVEIIALNSDIKMKNVSGPVVATTTNGDVEIVYSNLTPDKPNSITSVNGFVDISLPKNVAANMELHTVNGEAYTDWDIKVDKDASATMPVVAPNMNMFNLEGTINGGGTPITIQSVNGDIFLRKKK